jgi:hypothetical protein
MNHVVLRPLFGGRTILVSDSSIFRVSNSTRGSAVNPPYMQHLTRALEICSHDLIVSHMNKECLSTDALY